jgi:hypothetical protein
MVACCSSYFFVCITLYIYIYTSHFINIAYICIITGVPAVHLHGRDGPAARRDRGPGGAALRRALHRGWVLYLVFYIIVICIYACVSPVYIYRERDNVVPLYDVLSIVGWSVSSVCVCVLCDCISHIYIYIYIYISCGAAVRRALHRE